jgi:hypothetical protein
LAALCAEDPKFPATYDAWLHLVHEGERQTIAEGKSVVGLDVDPAEFEAWCHRVSIAVCFDALRAYLIVTRRALIAGQGQAQPGTANAQRPKPSDAAPDQRSCAAERWDRLFAPLGQGGLAAA